MATPSMSDHGAPWWADVQHLRPRDDRPAEPTRRFRSRAHASDHTGEDASVATLEHEVPAADPWAETLGAPSPWDATASGRTGSWDALDEDLAWDDAPRSDGWDDDDPSRSAVAGDAPADEPRSTLWDPALEEAFARTPSWAEEDDERLLPKGANRIENGRRTIEIRGQVDRIVGFTPPAETTVATRSGRRRPRRTPAERLAGRPDRVAMWAFLLGLLLIAIAAFTNPGDAGAAIQASGF